MSEKPHIVTAGGWARSGKGTTMNKLGGTLEELGKSVEIIDQGIKFRAMGEVVVSRREPLDSPVTLNDFIRRRDIKRATLEVLDEVANMDDAEVKARLYVPEISRAAGRVGSVTSSHEVAVGLLRSQVEIASQSDIDIILIDGRSIEKYAEEFTEDGLAKFVCGWYFKCDPMIAARRSLGMFADIEDLSPEEKQELLLEAMSISDRNRSDTLRKVDPLREPRHAYYLDLSTYSNFTDGTPFKRGKEVLHHGGLAVVDTSYTDSIKDMSDPIIEITMFALLHQRALTHADVGIQTITSPE